MLTRKNIIEKKKDDLQKIIDVWATKNKFLNVNERLEVSIKIKRRRVYEKSEIIREKIVRSDWIKIESLDWTNKQKAVLDLFKLNESLSAKKVAEKLPAIGDAVSVFTLIDAINKNFRDEHLPYCLKRLGGYGAYAPEWSYRIVVIKKKE
jgi:hypothetical protein